MFVSFRTALLVLASLASASVAPAQTARVAPASFTKSVDPAPEPLLASNELPRMVAPALIDPSTETAPAPVAPEPEADAPRPVAGESLSSMVARLRTSDAPSRERECLATAIYFESKSEPLAGQLAVGEVLANRVRSGRFAATYCGVVKQRGQFSFVRGGALPSVPRGSLQWKTAVAVATIVDSKLMAPKSSRALFFHATHVSPKWRATRIATIGNHVFYR